MRKGFWITFSDIGGENLAVTVQKQDLLKAVRGAQVRYGIVEIIFVHVYDDEVGRAAFA